MGRWKWYKERTRPIFMYSRLRPNEPRRQRASGHMFGLELQSADLFSDRVYGHSIKAYNDTNLGALMICAIAEIEADCSCKERNGS